MFSQYYTSDFPIRVRAKLDGSGEESTSRSSRRPKRSLSLAKSCLGTTPLSMASNYNNSMSCAAPQDQRCLAKSNSHNSAGAAAKGGGGGEKPKVNKEDLRPLPYHDYNPIIVRQMQTDEELPIHYWFYVYLYSSDVDKLLLPFVKMVDSFGTDRRLTVIMNRCKVQILLKDLELYKSLPRRIVVIKAAQWTSIVQALKEMEERLPDLMRFATFPLLMDTDTTKFGCTNFNRTACINRITKPIY